MNQPTQPAPQCITRLPRRRSRRRGYLTLEVIVAFLILLIAVLGVFQFGTVMVFKQTVMHAVTVAARESAKNASLDEVEASVNTILGKHALEIGDRATMLVEDIVVTQQRGTLDCTPLPTPVVDSDKVRVTLCVDLGRRPFLNPLRFFGVDLAGRTMTVHAVASKE